MVNQLKSVLLFEELAKRVALVERQLDAVGKEKLERVAASEGPRRHSLAELTKLKGIGRTTLSS